MLAVYLKGHKQVVVHDLIDKCVAQTHPQYIVLSASGFKDAKAGKGSMIRKVKLAKFGNDI